MDNPEDGKPEAEAAADAAGSRPRAFTRERYEIIVNALDAIVCEINATTLQVTFVSEGAEKILGYPVEHWLEPRFWIEHVHPDDRAWAAEAQKQIAAHREKRRIDYRMIGADGRVVWLRDILTGTVALNEARELYSVKVDVTAEKEAEQGLIDSERRLRALADRVVTVREDEARRIAREIHDEMGQILTGLKLDLRTIERIREQQGAPPENDGIQRRLTAMSAAIDKSAELTRRIVEELRPTVLDQLGLVAALEWQAREFEARTGVFCNLDLPETNLPVDDRQATTVFRIFQEVLTNIARHANATETNVILEQSTEEVVLTVVDNGRSVSQEELATTRGFGVMGMRERALAVGGNVTIHGQRGVGTTVVLRLPLGQKRND